MVKITFSKDSRRYNTLEFAMLTIGGVALFAAFYLMYLGYPKNVIGGLGSIACITSVIGIYSRRNRSR